MGAPVGNQNAKHQRRWQQAILRALSRASNADIDSGLDKAADKLVGLVMRGDKWALDHMADRVDGKAVAIMEDEKGNPVTTVTVKLITANHGGD